jgi:hypothetical protein
MLLYLLLHLLPQWWPWSGSTLYCTLYFCTSSPTRRQLPVLVTLSFAFVSDNCHFLLQCTLHQLQLFKCFLLRFCLEVYKLSFFCWKLAVATTVLNKPTISIAIQVAGGRVGWGARSHDPFYTKILTAQLWISVCLYTWLGVSDLKVRALLDVPLK